MLKRFFVVLAIALAVVLVLCWIYLPAVSRYHELKQEEERLGKRILEIDAQIKTLADEKYLLQHDLVYLEKVIREELGLVKPGEIIYEMVTRTQSAAPEKTSVKPAGLSEDQAGKASPAISSEVEKTVVRSAGSASSTRKKPRVL